MKKLLGIAILILPNILMMGLLGGYMLIASPASPSVQPVPPPCTEIKLKEYKNICMDMGIPYDIPLLADFFETQKYKVGGKLDIETIDVMHSALNFYYIREEVWRYVRVGTDRDGDPIYDWVRAGQNIYSGGDEIYAYITQQVGGVKRLPLSSPPAIAEIFDRMYETAQLKVTSNTRYETSLHLCDFQDYESILSSKWPGLTADEVLLVMNLHVEKYLPLMYNEAVEIAPGLANISLPEITSGDCTRTDLARMAASIIGWPYEWGGKSSSSGRPDGGLDCSGYIDWVYMQCFDKTVGAGTAGQFYNSQPIGAGELKIGDLGFYYLPEDCGPGKPHEFNHVGIYIGTIDGKQAFIHCGGSSFGTPASPTGRVGISYNVPGAGHNNVNPLGGRFSPPMKSTNFKYFRRPQFQFAGETQEGR